MHLWSVTTLVAASLLSLVGAAGSPEVWTDLARKHGGVIPLNPQLFVELTSQPRNYTAAILLTARAARFHCAPCVEFDPEYDLVASSWLYSSEHAGHAAKGEHVFFTRLDFDEGPEVFRMLSINSAPTLQLYQPTTVQSSNTHQMPVSGDSVETFDFNRMGPAAEPFVHFIRHRTKMNVPFNRPPDYTKAIQFLLGAMVITSFIVRYRAIFQSRLLWGLLTSLTAVFFTSGHMWNRIRTPPFVMVAPNREISYITGGYQNQLGVEPYFISFLYAMLAFTVYSLIHLIPNLAKLGDVTRQRVAVYVWLAVFFTLGSVLVALFRIKNPGYPFRGFF